jgi:triacylglycerol lipase
MDHIHRCHEMAQHAEAAYLDDASEHFKKYGKVKYEFIEDNGAQCHIAWDKDEIILAFRGTEPDEFSDIKADLNALPDRANNGHGLVHNGFQEEVNKVWDEVMKVLNKELKDRRLYICGHSLGGAMATIATSRLTGRVTCLYTYGSPRAGTKSFVKSFNTPHYRHVNNNDIVPKVPFAFLGYRHHGTLRYINFYGNIRKMSYWQRVKDGWRGRITAFKKKVPFDGAYDHGMNYYVEYTGKNQ